MAQRRSYISDGLFWGLMAFILAGTFGLGIAFAVAEIHGSGWLTGVAIGGAAALIGGIILARASTGAGLPPPNTVKAPVAPAGGAFRAPPGGAFRAPGAAASPAPARAPDVAAPAAAAEPTGTVEAAAEKVGFAASAAVTSAARAAREAMAEVADLAGAAKDRVAEVVEAIRPLSLSAPRDGGPDDLKKIKGVGPKLEELLHGLGYYHFDQIARWTPGEIAWVDTNLEGFHGRATRDDWVGQARLLAAGGETEFSERVDKGEVY